MLLLRVLVERALMLVTNDADWLAVAEDASRLVSMMGLRGLDAVTDVDIAPVVEVEVACARSTQGTLRGRQQR